MKQSDLIRRQLRREGFEEVWGDVDLVYGGTFAKDYGGWIDVIRIQDIGNTTDDAEDLLLVESRNMSFKWDWHRKDWCKAIDGMDVTYLRGKRALARLVVAASAVEYGISDPNGYGNGAFICSMTKSGRVNLPNWDKYAEPVSGWGYAALRRAIQEAIDLC